MNRFQCPFLTHHLLLLEVHPVPVSTVLCLSTEAYSRNGIRIRHTVTTNRNPPSSVCVPLSPYPYSFLLDLRTETIRLEVVQEIENDSQVQTFTHIIVGEKTNTFLTNG